jgi:protein-disulfide isomerase
VSDSRTADDETGAPRPRRRTHLIQLVVGVVILAAVAILVAVVVNGNHAERKVAAKAAAVAPQPKNMASDGVLVVGSGGLLRTVRTAAIPAGGVPVATDEAKLGDTANIVEYIDFQCPFCLEFEQTNLGNVAKWVGEGKATLEVHPISILDRSSEGTRYSSRSADAAACVADYDPDRYLFAVAALYDNQPAEGTSGLTDTKILSVLSNADATDPAIASCVRSERFRSFVSASTVRAVDGTFTGVATTPTSFAGTPTVFVDGAQYTGSLTDAAAFTAFVERQKPGATG